MQAEDRENSDPERRDILQRHRDGAQMQIERRHQRRERLRLGAVEGFDALLEEDRQSHGGDGERQHAMSDHRIDECLLEEHPEHERRDEDADQRRCPEGQMQKADGRQHEEGRQHDEFALREVDGLRGLPQQREADGDQRIDRSRGEAADQDLDQLRHGLLLPLAGEGAHRVSDGRMRGAGAERNPPSSASTSPRLPILGRPVQYREAGGRHLLPRRAGEGTRTSVSSLITDALVRTAAEKSTSRASAGS